MSVIQLVRLQEWRERQHLTQSELARRSGVKPATIARIERGVHQPRLATAFRLARALGIRPEQLLEWSVESEPAETNESAVDTPAANHAVIQGPLFDEFVLREPVTVKLWREGAEFVAEASELGVHAFGRSEDDAMANLRSHIVEQFRRLEELDGRLAPRMIAQRDRLRQALGIAYA
jgi:putative transcriptional regulator